MSLRNASNQLIKGNLRGAVKSLYEPIYIDPATYRTPYGNANWIFEMMNGQPGYFQYKDYNSCAEAYRRCAPVNAIINRKAQTFINGKTWVLNTAGKARGKVSTSEVAVRLTNLFNKPNPVQSGKQFEAQGYIFEQLFGFNIVLCMKPVGFDRTYTYAMWNIPASWLDIEETRKLFYNSQQPNIKKIVLTYNGERSELDIENLFIMKDNQPSFDTVFFPSSKLQPLSLVINNIIGAYESRNVLINYRGALGLLTTEQGPGQYAPMPMTPEEKEKLQTDFKKYGLMNKQWQVIITSAAMKWQQMGYATKDLMLFEEITDDIARLCDGIGYPDFLISSGTGQKSTYDNVKEGNKMLYQDFTIPDSCIIYEQWNNWFSTADYGLVIDKDYSHVPILQEDEKVKAEARLVRNNGLQIEWDTNQLTLNEWRVKNGEDPLPTDKGGDLYKNEYNEKFGTTPVASATGQAQGGTEGQNQSNQQQSNSN